MATEFILSIWRNRPHEARLRKREHFGALNDTTFSPDQNGAQAVIAALLSRHAENRRKSRWDDAPDFPSHGSRFIAMLMGHYLLEEKGQSHGCLDHRNFGAARCLVERNSEGCIFLAELKIEDVLELLFAKQERTMQRLYATFRRADLVSLL